MKDILLALRNLIETNLQRGDKEYILFCEIMTKEQRDYILGYDQIPCAIIIPGSIRPIAGPMGNHTTLYYDFEVQLIFLSEATLNGPRLEDSLGLYDTYDRLMTALVRDKRLGGLTVGMELPFGGKDLTLLGTDGNLYTGMSLSISYERFYNWDGISNSQLDVTPVLPVQPFQVFF